MIPLIFKYNKSFKRDFLRRATVRRRSPDVEAHFPQLGQDIAALRVSEAHRS